MPRALREASLALFAVELFAVFSIDTDLLAVVSATQLGCA